MLLRALTVGLLLSSCLAQQVGTIAAQKKTPAPSQTQVNWLYGAYIPKEVPLQPLTGKQRLQLYVRSTYTTPGIYVKTGLFSLRDQIKESPTEWGAGFEGYAKRLGSRQAQFAIQNSISAAGYAIARWEPRYDRCKCNGFWSRTAHAMIRNFITYGRNEEGIRPQVWSYSAAFGAGAIAAAWYPNQPSWTVKGYQAAVAQVGVGIGVNWLSEFAPEITRLLRRGKTHS